MVRLPEMLDLPVFSSSLALFKACIMSVIDFIVPFLYLVSRELLGLGGWAYILKFPPTKNWRPMIAISRLGSVVYQGYLYSE